MAVRRGEVAEAPLRVLSAATRQLISTRLDSRKILLTPQYVHRDWRGVAEQAALDVSSIICWGKISPMEHCLHILSQKGILVGQLWTFLEAMDRFDVIDDSLHMIYADYDRVMKEGNGALAAIPPPMDQLVSDMAVHDQQIITVDDHRNLRMGLGLQHYHALVLFADEDIDFVQTMVEKMEGEYDLKLCLKDRDLVGGLQFESDSIVRLIIERCSRVVIVLSPEFLASSANNFFVLFAHALSVEQRRRIIIPCLCKPCIKPPIINFCHSLDYFRAKGYWDYWQKLHISITYEPSTNPSEARARIRELSGSSTTSSQASSPTPLALSSPSPSQSTSFFKFLRKSDNKNKSKTTTTTTSQSEKEEESSREEHSTGNEHNKNAALTSSSNINGFPRSPAIPISQSSEGERRRTRGDRPVLQLSQTSLMAGESSSDHTVILPALPDAPNSPLSSCPSPATSTTSSSAFLLPPLDDDPLQQPSSPSRFLKKIFRTGKKKQKIPG